MESLKRKWQTLIAISAKILDLTAKGGTKAYDYWAKKVAPNGKLHFSAHEIHQWWYRDKCTSTSLYNWEIGFLSQSCVSSNLICLSQADALYIFFIRDSSCIRNKKHSMLLTWPSTKQAWWDLVLSILAKHKVESKNKAEVEISEREMAKKASELRVADKICCGCTVIAHLY